MTHKARKSANPNTWTYTKNALKLQFESSPRFDPESKRVVQQVLDSMTFQQEAAAGRRKG
jgi:hypothetical protein